MPTDVADDDADDDADNDVDDNDNNDKQGLSDEDELSDGSNLFERRRPLGDHVGGRQQSGEDNNRHAMSARQHASQFGAKKEE
jgi:hypothetical protein